MHFLFLFWVGFWLPLSQECGNCILIKDWGHLGALPTWIIRLTTTFLEGLRQGGEWPAQSVYCYSVTLQTSLEKYCQPKTLPCVDPAEIFFAVFVSFAWARNCEGARLSGKLSKGSLRAVCARYSSRLTITMAVCRYLQSNFFLHKIPFKKLFFIRSIFQNGRKNSISFRLKKLFFFIERHLNSLCLFLRGSRAKAKDSSTVTFTTLRTFQSLSFHKVNLKMCQDLSRVLEKC